MKEKVYNFDLEFNWRLLRIISQIDRFDASWSSIEKVEGERLKELKAIATIQSVGASTRIEGSKMTDEAVEILLEHIDISKIKDRDSQEVVGYFNVLDVVSDSYESIEINENNIKNLHNQLLKLSSKDQWHRGDYKTQSNAVEAQFPDGSRQIIFRTTPPGFATEDAMRNLIEWFHQEEEVHPLIVVAAFVYDFVSIHPFQDGNGRLSRLLTTLLLLKTGYQWIQYVSFEHEIERNKKSYYRSLRNCQAQRPNEDITEWIQFFLNSLINVQTKLMAKLEWSETVNELSDREKLVYEFIQNNPKCKIGMIVKNLEIPKHTVKRILPFLLSSGLIVKYGVGSGTNYAVRNK